MNPKIFIGTPTANGLVANDYSASLIHMVQRLEAAGIRTLYRIADGPNFAVQRDMLADAFLRSDATHLLLVDGDMRFEPDLCERLLACGWPLVGAVCARPALDLARLERLLATHAFEDALALAYDWNVRFLGRSLEIRNGFCRVAGLGPGFALIARACLDAMAAGDAIGRYRGPHGVLRAFFRETAAGEGQGKGDALDSDGAFCRRYAACGGEVWAYVNADLRRIGDFHYGVPFAAYLSALRSTPEPDAGREAS